MRATRRSTSRPRSSRSIKSWTSRRRRPRSTRAGTSSTYTSWSGSTGRRRSCGSRSRRQRRNQCKGHGRLLRQVIRQKIGQFHKPSQFHKPNRTKCEETQNHNNSSQVSLPGKYRTRKLSDSAPCRKVTLFLRKMLCKRTALSPKYPLNKCSKSTTSSTRSHPRRRSAKSLTTSSRDFLTSVISRTALAPSLS